MRTVKAKCRFVLSIGLLFFGTAVLGQENSATKTGGTEADTTTTDEGGWKYLGQRMWFEVKKRMNLTSEEEEQAEEKNEGKNIRLKILGVEVTRPGKDT